MKKIILKSLELTIKIIELLEDHLYGYHIDLDTGKKVISTMI